MIFKVIVGILTYIVASAVFTVAALAQGNTSQTIAILAIGSIVCVLIPIGVILNLISNKK